MDLTTQQDITNLGGKIQGHDHVSTLADRDITSALSCVERYPFVCQTEK
ncbi:MULTISPECIES: hypothetical protein [Photorhabdus]|nr:MULTISPECIES: hypothetical protein [Photorhabdus]MCC8466981.1 hypothetical protein [Photorhabdus bodei]